METYAVRLTKKRPRVNNISKETKHSEIHFYLQLEHERMKIDLAEKIATHFKRLEDLADKAADDGDESYSSRASAMTALTVVIKQLTKEQEKIINMAALQELQSSIVEALEEYSPELKTEVLTILERRLATLS